MISSLFWDFTQRRLVVCYWHFGTTYKGSSSLHKIPEEWRSHWHYSRSQKL